jgi:superfamily II DNA or RNA helicase
MAFGKTWWGEHWLRALKKIDYENRIPRGATYARQGRVKQIHLKAHTIEAQVAGTLPFPYLINIELPPFDAVMIKGFLTALAHRPALIAKLLNRELDPAVLELATQNGLKVFPNRWNDLKMSCSCPDWAVPCKHLAAVIYQMSSEIDNDPFIVFKLHGVDLLKELQRNGLHIGKPSMDIPFIHDLLWGSQVPEGKFFEPTSAYQRPSLPYPEPIDDLLVSLLEPDPPFYTLRGEFREKYRVGLNKVRKKMQRVVQGKQPLHDLLDPYNEITEEITSRSIFHITITEQLKAIVTCSGKKIPALGFLANISRIHPSRIVDYQQEVAVTHTLLMTAAHLIAMGGVVPTVVRNRTHEHMVWWMPALLSPDIKALSDKLTPMIPPGLLKFEIGAEKLPFTRHPGVNALSIIITTLIHHISEKQYNDLFLDLFFTQATYKFNRPGEESLPGGIMMWLSRYFMSMGRFRPSLFVREAEPDNFEVDVMVSMTDSLTAPPVALSSVFNDKRFGDHLFEVLQSLTALSAFVPELDDHINQKGKTPIRMNNITFTHFLTQMIPAMKLLQVQVVLPKSLETLIRPKSSVRLTTNSGGKPGISLKAMFDFEWRVALGNVFLTEEEFYQLLHNTEGLIRFKGGYVYMSSEQVEQIRKFFAKKRTLSSSELIRIALGEEFEGAPVEFSHDAKALIRSIREVEEVELPEGIIATLRPYQVRGFSWLYKNATLGLGSVIADDMGLGKTLQVITTLQKFLEEGELYESKAIVVAPTGLLANWQAEVEKFAPDIVTYVYHGTNRSLPDQYDFDLLITSYGVVRSDVETLKNRHWKMVIIDEAQNIKNHQVQQTKAVKALKAEHYIAMSGTPVENRLSELWSIMDFSNKGLMGSLKEFEDDFSYPVEQMNDPKAAKRLKRITSPFLLRRMKTDKHIISDLPEKIEINTYASLTTEQSVLYQKTLNKAIETIEEISSTDSESMFKRQGLVLQMILALKQICNHPVQFLKSGSQTPQQSGKTMLLFDTLETILERNEKVLIFSQFKQMGDLLSGFLAERYGEEPLFLHGGCSTKQRQEMISRFQNNHADKIFLLSLKAAGTGLNLTAASHVIHYDLWWNPAVEAQATDRAYRIGQKNNVMVHRFITKETFEEKIDAMIQSKKHLADITLAAGENWIGKLSNKELRQIFGR